MKMKVCIFGGSQVIRRVIKKRKQWVAEMERRALRDDDSDSGCGVGGSMLAVPSASSSGPWNRRSFSGRPSKKTTATLDSMSHALSTSFQALRRVGSK